MSRWPLIFTPVFTLGLGALPPHLYSHGSSMLGTLQQVAAAIGTAVVVTILSVRSATLASSGSDPVSALSGGIQLGMVFAAVTGVAVLVLAFFMPGRESAGQGHGPELEGEVRAPGLRRRPAGRRMTRCGLDAVLVAGTSRRRPGCGRRHGYASVRPVAAARRDTGSVVHGCRPVPHTAGATLRWRGRAI